MIDTSLQCERNRLLQKMKKLRKWLLIFGATALALYLLGFLVLWLGGGYILTESGRVRAFMGIPTGIAAPDVAEWQPLFGHCQPKYSWAGGDVSPRCDFIGWMYFPLWLAVQSRYEPMQLLDDNGMLVEPIERPDGFKFHPLRGRELRTVLPETTAGIQPKWRSGPQVRWTVATICG